MSEVTQADRNLLHKADIDRAVSRKVLGEVGEGVDQLPEVLAGLLHHPLQLHAGDDLHPQLVQHAIDLLPHPVIDKLIQCPLHACVHHLQRDYNPMQYCHD